MARGVGARVLERWCDFASQSLGLRDLERWCYTGQGSVCREEGVRTFLGGSFSKSSLTPGSVLAAPKYR